MNPEPQSRTDRNLTHQDLPTPSGIAAADPNSNFGVLPFGARHQLRKLLGCDYTRSRCLRLSHRTLPYLAHPQKCSWMIGAIAVDSFEATSLVLLYCGTILSDSDGLALDAAERFGTDVWE